MIGNRADSIDLDLSCVLCGLELSHPVINGSGTFDVLAAVSVFGEEILEPGVFPFSAFVSKTITESPRPGNPPHRIWEAPSGLINSIGLPNPGLQAFVPGDLRRLGESLPVPLVVSLMAEDADGFARLVEAVAASGYASAIELNVSCPNVHSGLIVGEEPSEAEALVGRLSVLTDLPLIVKLTPNTARPDEVARAAEASGASAVSLINTLKAVAIDPGPARRWLGAGSGGLSGPAVRPVALQQVASVSAAVEIPVIGMGGVTDGESAAEFILAGASAVAVGTESFRDPAAGRRVAGELGRALGRRGLGSLDEAIGAATA